MQYASVAKAGLPLTDRTDQTDGSIISPASGNGVVAFKPTLGLVSSDGLVLLALKQDVPGPITRTVVDAAYMLDAIAEEHPSRRGVSYASAFSGTDLSGLRIGVSSSSLLQLSDVPMEAFHEALRLLESCGANIVHGANYAGLDEFKSLSQERQLLVLAGYFQTDIKEYFGNLTTKPHALIRALVTLFDLLSRIQRKNTPSVASTSLSWPTPWT